MSREVKKHEQLTFDFDKEYPSLVEPLQQKEKELGDSSPELTPLNIKLNQKEINSEALNPIVISLKTEHVNFYLEKDDLNNIQKAGVQELAKIE